MLIDSNILIYALNQSSPHHQAAQDFLQQQLEKLVLAQQNIFETLRVVTHSKFVSPFPPTQAIEAVWGIADQVKIIAPTFETPAIARQLITKYQISGSEVFDAYLVATALSNQITNIVTDNIKHLQKYQEITVVNPFV